MRKTVIKTLPKIESIYLLDVTRNDKITVYKDGDFFGMIIYQNNDFHLMTTCDTSDDCYVDLHKFLNVLIDNGYKVYVE